MSTNVIIDTDNMKLWHFKVCYDLLYEIKENYYLVSLNNDDMKCICVFDSHTETFPLQLFKRKFSNNSEEYVIFNNYEDITYHSFEMKHVAIYNFNEMIEKYIIREER